MKKILITALAFAGFAIAAPNHITKSNYTTYTSWDKDYFSYYALNNLTWISPINSCHYNGKPCNIAVVNQYLKYNIPNDKKEIEGILGSFYTLYNGSLEINSNTHIDSIFYDSSKTKFQATSPSFHFGKETKNFTKSKWRSKGMPTSVSELSFTIDTSSANYTITNKTQTLNNKYDTLKTTYNGQSIYKDNGYLYIPPGEYYFDNFVISNCSNCGKKGNVQVKLLNPRKATIIHVKNTLTWRVQNYINKPSASDPDVLNDLNKNFLIMHHNSGNINIEQLRGSVIAPYSNVILEGPLFGSILANNILLSKDVSSYYVKFNPTSW